MEFLPREIINQILLFSGHLVILEGKLYSIRKIRDERKQIVENIFIQNPLKITWNKRDILVEYVVIDITKNKDNPKYYVITKFLAYSINRDYEKYCCTTNTKNIY